MATQLDQAGDAGHDLRAPELSGVWAWQPGDKADTRRNGGIFSSARWSLPSMGGPVGRPARVCRSLSRSANPAGSAHPLGRGWRFTTVR